MQKSQPQITQRRSGPSEGEDVPDSRSRNMGMKKQRVQEITGNLGLLECGD